MDMRCRLISSIGVALATLAPALAEAQTIQGRVLEAGAERPIATALVRLVDASGDERRAAAADSAGRYRLTAPAPGRYRLRAELLGYETLETDFFRLADSLVVLEHDLRLRPAPIPISGVEVTTDAVNRRLRQFFAMAPAQFRIRPIRAQAIEDNWRRGNDLPDLMSRQPIPNLEVLRSRSGPCYQFRRQGCLPVFLDGARLTSASAGMVPLEMLNTIVVLLPSESVAYPQGAVHLFSIGFMR